MNITNKTIQAKEIISAHPIPTEAFLATGNTLANDSQNEIYEYTHGDSIICFNTDTFGSWGIGQISLPKETPKNKVMEEAFRRKAHVIVKPQNGKWYIKGFKGKKNYQTIKTHLEINQNNNHRPKTETTLIKYTDFQKQTHKSQKIKSTHKNSASTNTITNALGFEDHVKIPVKNRTINNWLVRIGDGINFNKSRKHSIFSCSKVCKSNSTFIKDAKRGDNLLFIPNNSKSKVAYIATFYGIKERTADTMTNQQLGWDSSKKWDNHYELHYTNLYDLSCVEPALYIPIKGPAPFREYHESHYNINLIQLLKQIKRFAKVTF